MVELRWITFFVMLQFAAVSGKSTTYVTVTARAGDEVTLPCNNVIKNQHKCDQTSWLFSQNTGKTTQELINLGQIGNSEIAEAKSSRLSVTADCSLGIKNVTRENAGLYSCRQFNRAGKLQGGDALVDLSVVRNSKDETEGDNILHPSFSLWWRIIIVLVGLAALLAAVVVVNMWMRIKGNQTQREDNAEQNDEDGDEGTVTYENVGEPSVSIRLH